MQPTTPLLPLTHRRTSFWPAPTVSLHSSLKQKRKIWYLKCHIYSGLLWKREGGITLQVEYVTKDSETMPSIWIWCNSRMRPIIDMSRKADTPLVTFILGPPFTVGSRNSQVTKTQTWSFPADGWAEKESLYCKLLINTNTSLQANGSQKTSISILHSIQWVLQQPSEAYSEGIIDPILEIRKEAHRG